jgi:hypothetical protein
MHLLETKIYHSVHKIHNEGNAFVPSAAFFMPPWLFTRRCWQSPAVTILIGPSLFGDPLARESNHRSENLARTDTTNRRDKDGMNGRPAQPFRKRTDEFEDKRYKQDTNI